RQAQPARSPLESEELTTNGDEAARICSVRLCPNRYFRFPLPGLFVFIRACRAVALRRRVDSWSNAILIALLIVNLTGCAFISRHQFVEPAVNWQTRSGQLLYRNARRT